MVRAFWPCANVHFNSFLSLSLCLITAYRPFYFYKNVTYLQCRLCPNFTATNKSSIIHHIASAHTLRPHNLFREIPITLRPKIQCSKCNETFHRKRDFIDHMTYTHKEYYYCVACGKTNYYRRLHQRHMVKMHNNSTATQIVDDWDNVEKLWTSGSQCSPENEPTYGDSIFTVNNSEEYNSVTEPHILLRSLGN